ncbi:HalX domain-containing protein [Mesorhizobium sp.]|uniref:HalX domain-containing protein n=1 Tax=Mesorhizobium sp. TaxID=1871066 RepID=UPI000FE5EA3A|nr:HalX domain-containing protein [Mesorhizobium sp.]RWP28059.1 MAG: hypothetical protein EOR02_20590 [Mesorhizobium sp.]
MSRLFIATCALFAPLFWTLPSPAGQSFSCSFGEPACLDYGAVICKSSATCVSKDAICFDSYTCDYNGFVCKSKFDVAVDAYDTQLRKYNELVDKYNVLNSAYEEVQAEKAAAFSELEAAQAKARRMSDCIDRVDSIEGAKACS